MLPRTELPGISIKNPDYIAIFSGAIVSANSELQKKEAERRHTAVQSYRDLGTM